MNEALGSEATLSSQNELQREAELLFDLGRISEAIEVDREILRRFAAMEAGGTPPPAFVTSPARHAIAGGNVEDGEAWMRSVLPKFERDGPESFARGVALDLASAYVVQGRYAEARSTLRRFEARLTNGPARPRERVDATRIGVEIALGVRDTRGLRPALDALEAALTADRVARLNSFQGYLTAGLGRLALRSTQLARSHAEHALELASAKVIDGQSSAWVGASQLLLARIALADNDRDAARQRLASAGEQFADTLASDHRWRVAVASLRAGS